MSAYLIGHVNITNPERYADYTKDVPASLEPFGGKFLVRGGKYETKEGDWSPQRMVVIEFPSFEAAQAWYDSDFYREIVKIRWEASEAKIMIVDGFNP
jgi:uncharacterized protein (DUF1330 family)